MMITQYMSLNMGKSISSKTIQQNAKLMCVHIFMQGI